MGKGAGHAPDPYRAGFSGAPANTGGYNPMHWSGQPSGPPAAPAPFPPSNSAFGNTGGYNPMHWSGQPSGPPAAPARGLPPQPFQGQPTPGSPPPPWLSGGQPGAPLPPQSMTMNPYRIANDPYRQGITDQINPNYKVPVR